MCWDYSDCGACGKRTQCSASCYCETEEECEEAGHQDCKSFERCKQCGDDLCNDCWSESHYCDEKCKKQYKLEKAKKLVKKLENNESDSD